MKKEMNHDVVAYLDSSEKVRDVLVTMDMLYDEWEIDYESRELSLPGTYSYRLSYRRLKMVDYLKDNRCRIVTLEELAEQFESTTKSVHVELLVIKKLNKRIPILTIGKKGYMWYNLGELK